MPDRHVEVFAGAMAPMAAVAAHRRVEVPDRQHGAAQRPAALVERHQIGGRAVAPRDGDDPDAVLSRVGAAVAGGDLEAALAEIAALPQGARDVLAPWVADVEARRAAEAGLAALTAALAATDR